MASSPISSISRKIGILVVFGVPVIVGGGIVYHFTESYTAMFFFEALLVFTALGFIKSR